MEEVKICEFISYGDGNGYGYGDGSVDGYGNGNGDGYGSVDGYGDGSGYGYGDGIKAFNGFAVYMIDGVPTIITSLHNDIAKGFVLNNDMTLSPCYVVKENNMFAHGTTLHEAQEALQEKLFDDMDEDERIAAFWDCHEKNKKYPVMDFFEWHHKLTGSCLMGRKAFAKNHNVDLDGTMTVEEFIKLTENDFGGKIIQKLKKEK